MSSYKFIIKLILLVVCTVLAGVIYHAGYTDSYFNTYLLLLIFVSQKTWFDDLQ